MSTRLLIVLAVIFFVGMLAVKAGATIAVDTLGAWIAIPIIAVILVVSVFLDRLEKKRHFTD